MTENILVMRYGALGDMVMCFQAFAEIRAAHKDAKITFLTAPAFVEFAKRMPWFDDVIPDLHPGKLQIGKWLQQARTLYKLKPTRVYELHGKLRQSITFWLLGGPLWGPEWSGAARFCSYPRLWPPQPGMHFVDFVAAQLRRAGVPEQATVDIAWLDGPVERLALPLRYAVLIPSCTPGQFYKRWPSDKYAELAKDLLSQKVSVIVVGTKNDGDAIQPIKAAVPEIIDLSGKTNLFELAGLLRRASAVVGNDTGPMHMAAALGAPTLALLSARTNPVWSVLRMPKTKWLQSPDLGDLSVEKVSLALQGLMSDKMA